MGRSYRARRTAPPGLASPHPRRRLAIPSGRPHTLSAGGRRSPDPASPPLPAAGGGRIVLARTGDGGSDDRGAAGPAPTPDGGSEIADPGDRDGAAGGAVGDHPAQ